MDKIGFFKLTPQKLIILGFLMLFVPFLYIETGGDCFPMRCDLYLVSLLGYALYLIGSPYPHIIGPIANVEVSYLNLILAVLIGYAAISFIISKIFISKAKLVEKNLNGFGAIGILAVIAAILILAGGGYFAYQRYQDRPCEEAATPARNFFSRTCKLFPDYCSVPPWYVVDESCAQGFYQPSPGRIDTSTPAPSEVEGWKTYPSTSSGQAAIDTSDWKVYRNEYYGFEVRYPPDFIISSGSNVDWDEYGRIKRVVQIPPYPETPGAIEVYIINDKNHIFSESPAPVAIREYVPFAAESKFANMIEDDLVVRTNLEKILRIGYEPFKNKQVYRVYWKPDTNNI